MDTASAPGYGRGPKSWLPRTCIECGACFFTTWPRMHLCSDACRLQRLAQRYPKRPPAYCQDCGVRLRRGGDGDKWCPVHREARKRAANLAWQRRRYRRRAPYRIVAPIPAHLAEDWAQEKALAALEGREPNRREFYRQHAPWKERARIPDWRY